VETKNNDATTRAQKMRRGNEMRCAEDAAGGLFDIVKKDDGRAGRILPGLRVCARHPPAWADCRSLPLQEAIVTRPAQGSPNENRIS
jgi:hypothetical protein